MYFVMSLVLNVDVCGVRITPVASRLQEEGQVRRQPSPTSSPLFIHFSVALATLYKGVGKATSSLFASASFPLPTTFTEFRALVFRYPSQVDRNVLPHPPPPLLYLSDRHLGRSCPRAVSAIQPS